MDYNLMEAFEKVVNDLVEDGMTQEQAEGIMKKVIWNLICRI